MPRIGSQNKNYRSASRFREAETVLRDNTGIAEAIRHRLLLRSSLLLGYPMTNFRTPEAGAARRSQFLIGVGGRPEIDESLEPRPRWRTQAP